MPLPDDDRHALALRLDALVPGAVDAITNAVDDGEDLRDAFVAGDGKVVVVTARRVLVVAATKTRRVTPIELDAVEILRRDAGLGIDITVAKGHLTLRVPRSTFDRLAALGAGSAPGRASWLPVPPPRPKPAPSESNEPTEPTEQATAAAQPPAPAPPRPAWTGGSTVPVPAGPWVPQEGWSAQATTSPPAARPAPTAGPPPGWHADPSARHWWRWWDGQDWTDHVADGGAPFVDPLPPGGGAAAGR